jgi:ribosomal protein L28
MLGFLAMASWSPYVVGAGIGVLIWTTFLLSDHPLGCSTGYAKTAGLLETAVSREKAGAMPYYRQFVPAMDWWWMLVVGLVIGAFLSATLSGTFSIVLVPPRKGPVLGHNVSHANNRTKRKWSPNLQQVRIQTDKGVRKVRVCTQCILSDG